MLGDNPVSYLNFRTQNSLGDHATFSRRGEERTKDKLTEEPNRKRVYSFAKSIKCVHGNI